MAPEEKARRRIDEQLSQAGWVVQDFADMNPSGGFGIAVGCASPSSGAARQG
jgi:type I restriction enzyme R subunit